jgi:hypothetical protein
MGKNWTLAQARAQAQSGVLRRCKYIVPQLRFTYIAVASTRFADRLDRGFMEDWNGSGILFVWYEIPLQTHVRYAPTMRAQKDIRRSVRSPSHPLQQPE